jgi:hypothetical protein
VLNHASEVHCQHYRDNHSLEPNLQNVDSAAAMTYMKNPNILKKKKIATNLRNIYISSSDEFLLQELDKFWCIRC